MDTSRIDGVYTTRNTHVKIIIIVLLEVGRLHVYLRQIYGRQPLEGLQALRTGHIDRIVRRRYVGSVALDVLVDGARYVRRDDTRLGHRRGEDFISFR